MEIRKSQDHPRVCGEKYSFAHFFSPSLGSPPRVRGKVEWRNPEIYADEDHPRVCGEKCLLDVL